VARREDALVRPAQSREEFEQAFRLVYQSYLDRGYIEESPQQIRLSVFNAFPTSVTLVSVVRETVVATVSLVKDTPVGLPMDEIYHNEVQQLRNAGRRLIEVTMLADRRRELHRALTMVLELMKRVFDYAALVANANDLCITINPRHETYYESFLLFEPLGGLKAYPSVRNNPALAKRLDLDHVREKCDGNQELIERFFTDRTPLNVLEGGYRMTADDLHYFFVELTTAFRDASPEVRECLRGYYPACPWEEWLPGA
jgi:hypothetical protein